MQYSIYHGIMKHDDSVECFIITRMYLVYFFIIVLHTANLCLKMYLYGWLVDAQLLML